MTGRLPISLLSALAWGQLAKALVPADPTITTPALLPRQNNDRFIGWVETSGTWFSEQCNPGLTWYQDGQYAQCCPTTLASCYAPTACVNGQMIYPYSDESTTSTIACTDNYNNPSFSICNTVFIFENFDDSQPQTDIVCGESSVNWSYYRKIPATATQPPSSAPPSSSPSPVSTPTPLPGNTDPPSPDTPAVPKKKSQAWIAGAVVGPIVGIAAIAAIVFCLLRRKKSVANQNSAQPPHGAPTVITPTGVQQYTEAKPAFNPQATTNNQTAGAFNPHESYYGNQPTSPAPQYTAPYDAPGSPPPPNVFPQDTKYAYQHPAPEPSHPNTAELGGVSSPATGTHTAELSGDHITR